MSTPGLFVVGALVTLIVAAAPALLFYAIVLDRRHASEMKFAGEQPLGSEGQQAVPEADHGPLVAA
ncbi:MAG: hypothetical protein M3Y09_14260 [Actinomycetota bacterium]|nr:hypothetical protein [Actinomycetota bacterium]